ncbi:MAG: molybdenum cofactor cytidylyltransferase [Tissierellales bacterium]|nr:molybdenum cofactor cytidylyltransferase [Tissierellales bacterium]
MLTGIILAAGSSERMGKEKLTMELNGMTVIEMVLNNAISSNLDEIILVYKDPNIGLLANKKKIKAIYNKNASNGQSESIKIGVANAKEESNYLFLLGDQPFIFSEIINRIINNFNKDKDKIIIPYYAGVRGNPVLLPNKFKKELLSLSGDEGARNIFRKYNSEIRIEAFENHMYNLDIDNIKDYELAKSFLYSFNNAD